MKVRGAAKEDDDEVGLTEKQRLVLDLLIENKTSKEIGRALGISPYTVDQRISLARGKLGVSSRNELAARYRVMRKTLGRSPAELFAGVEAEQPAAAQDVDKHLTSTQRDYPSPPRAPQDGGLTASAASAESENFCPTEIKMDYRVGPEVFEGRSGGLWRFCAIVATALLLVMTILGLFAIFDQLNDVLA
jgi:DNA-binding CsgD family transcriptional regulator